MSRRWLSVFVVVALTCLAALWAASILFHAGHPVGAAFGALWGLMCAVAGGFLAYRQFGPEAPEVVE